MDSDRGTQHPSAFTLTPTPQRQPPPLTRGTCTLREEEWATFPSSCLSTTCPSTSCQGLSWTTACDSGLPVSHDSHMVVTQLSHGGHMTVTWWSHNCHMVVT